jgi:hypothetical protein
VTTPDLTPFWPADEDWCGYLLMIVPAARLPVPPQELALRVRERVEADAELHDLVTVSHAPRLDEFDDATEWDRALAASLVAAVMPEGHVATPRGVLRMVVVGERKQDIDRLVLELRQVPLLKHLRVRVYTYPTRLELDSGGVPTTAVANLAGLARTIVSEHERDPEYAVDEPTFLAELRRLVEEEGLALSGPEPSPPAPPDPVSSATPGVDTGAPAARGSASVPAPARPTAQPSRPIVDPVIHGGADIDLVSSRSMRQRRTGAPATDAESVDRVARLTEAVSLAYLVFVPDDEPKPREVGRRCRALAVDLDQALRAVVGDSRTGRQLTVAVEVLTATVPLRKYGPPRPAGEVTESGLPRVPAELFDLLDTVDALLDAAQRTERAFRSRDVAVLSKHFIFLSTVRLRDAHTSASEWERLLNHARVTWVDIGSTKVGNADLAELVGVNDAIPQIGPSPYGFHMLSDKDDVVGLFRQESSIIYTYQSPALPPEPSAPPAAVTPAAATPAGKSRRWWPRRRSSPPSNYPN